MNEQDTSNIDEIYEEESSDLGTRKPLEPWDRIKILMLLVVVWALLTSAALNNNPLESVLSGARIVAHNDWWLTLLLTVEVLRQLHYMISEHSSAWHEYWSADVFGRFSEIGKDWNDWTRFRVARVTKIAGILVLVAVILGSYYHTSPLVSLFKVPAAIFSALPLIMQVVLILLLGVMQFVAIFWFMSRGGTDVYFPGDIKTRFSDVWGQDAVLARVKENIIFLKDPEAIEERGGYVPGGILLWGPPGTGKTLMAEAVAGETQNPFVFVDPGAFINMFFGVGILKVKSLFRKLRKLSLRYGGVVVFFDEADSLGSRGSLAPEGTFRFSPAGSTIATPGCNGMSYLSTTTSSVLFQNSLSDTAQVREAAPRSWVSKVVTAAGLGGGMGGGGMGTLQALLTELSGLKKPRGFFNRTVRRALGLTPKAPPKYRILVMMATNLPEALDEALLRPGRIDRIYRVGYPSKGGRIRTYKGYLAKVDHELSEEEIDRIATITPYATGATIKDLVNEALIHAIRDDRDVITWKDIVRAKQLRELGPPEDVEYIERERHAVAVHEACHAVIAVRVRQHLTIDIATIEKGSNFLGMVASIPPEDQFTSWRSEFEADIMVSLASLAGERIFFRGDNSSGVAGDLSGATQLATLMEGYWGMGSTISVHGVTQGVGVAGGGRTKRPPGQRDTSLPNGLGERIESRLERIYLEVTKLIEQNRLVILSVAHALETNKTVTGEDVLAIVHGEKGPLLDGRIYKNPEILAAIERYHESAAEAHASHQSVVVPLPLIPEFTKSFEAMNVAQSATSSAVAMQTRDDL